MYYVHRNEYKIITVQVSLRRLIIYGHTHKLYGLVKAKNYKFNIPIVFSVQFCI